MAYEKDALKKRICDRGYDPVPYLEKIAKRIEGSRIVCNGTKYAIYSTLSQAYGGLRNSESALKQIKYSAKAASVLRKEAECAQNDLGGILSQGRKALKKSEALAGELLKDLVWLHEASAKVRNGLADIIINAPLRQKGLDE